MRKIVILLCSIFIVFGVYSKECQELYSSEKLALAYKLGEEVSIVDQSWDLVFWHNTTLPVDKLNIEVEEISGFECTVQLKKTSNECLILRVIWEAGYDISGCFMLLKDSFGNELGNSSIFIGY